MEQPKKLRGKYKKSAKSIKKAMKKIADANQLQRDREQERQRSVEALAEVFGMGERSKEFTRPVPETSDDTITVESLSTLSVFADQSVKTLVVPATKKLSRRELLDVVRVLKVGGTLRWA